MELLLSASAEQDLADAMAWYDANRPGLGGEFLLAVQARLAIMAERPWQFPLFATGGPRQFRFALVRRFPYRILFEIRSENRVIVLGLAHTSRGPRSWRERLA